MCFNWRYLRKDLEVTPDSGALDTARTMISPYLVATPEQLDLLVLWAAHSYVYECFAASPRLSIRSTTPGAGKEQPMSEPVLTPSGWTTMGDLKEGDFVIGSNGQPTKVVRVFPQGVKEVYKVTFSDGASTRTGADHLWQVTKKRTRGGVKKEVLTTAQIKQNGLYYVDGHKKYSIPIVSPVEFDSVPLPIDPWLLGYLLGDGSFRDTSVVITTADTELIDRVRSIVSPDLHVTKMPGHKYGYRLAGTQGRKAGGGYSPLVKALRELGLWGHKSEEKFIPSMYLKGSWKDRYALLQGLMDSDGTPCHNGGTEFSTSSEAVKNGIVELARSLGGTAKWSSRMPKFVYKGEKRTGLRSYRVNVKMPADLVPFTLTRHVNNWVAPTKYSVARYITSIEKLDYDEESQCILVDAPDHLYVTNDYVVTHNTTFLAVMKTLSSNGESVSHFTPASLYSLLDSESVTMFLDEIDNCFSQTGFSRAQPALQAILNDGYSRDGFVRVMRGGVSTKLSVFAPVTFAGIGRLPLAMESRTLPVMLKKGIPEMVFDPSIEGIEISFCAELLKDWLSNDSARELLRQAERRPEIKGIDDPRQRQIIAPLMAIAELAGGDWPERAVAAARHAFLGVSTETQLTRFQLALRDCLIVWPKDVSFMEGKKLSVLMAAMPNSVWAKTLGGEGLTGARLLAALLSASGVASSTHRIDGVPVTSYARADLEKAVS